MKLLLVAGLPAVWSYKVLVDLNTWTAQELASLPQVGKHDGTWVIHVNSPGVDDGLWRQSIHGDPIVTEDNPMGFAECQWLGRLLGAGPTYAMGYHEDAITPSPTKTLLNWGEVDQYAKHCGGHQVIALTRAYWPGSDWEQHTNAILRHPSLGGVAMEYNPQDTGLRSEDHFVSSILAAGRKVFFLWPLRFNGKTTEQNVIDSLHWMRSHGVNLADPRVHFVIARYDKPHVPVLGASNSVESAVKAALRFRAALEGPMPSHHSALAGPTHQSTTPQDEQGFVHDVIQHFVALGKDPSPNPLCIVRSCGSAVKSCLFDADCRRALTCTAGCGKTVNQTCIFQCTSDFENDVYDGLLYCMFNAHDCMGTAAGYDIYQGCRPMDKVVPLTQYRGKPLTQEVARGIILRGGSKGNWMVAQGLSAAYDCFDCQFLSWEALAAGYMEYVAEYKIHKSDGGIRWNFAKYNATEWLQTSARYTVNSSSYGGLAHFEDWRLLAADEAEQPEWLAFYYCGSAPGVGEAYEGAFILTPDGALPEASAQARLNKMYSDIGLQLRCKVDNSNCSSHPPPPLAPSLAIIL